MAKTGTAARSLSQQFQRGTVGKTYLAIIDASRMPLHWRRVAASPTEIKCNIEYTETGPRLAVHTGKAGKDDSKHASTVLQILSANDRFALLQLQPSTGRKHQLRLVCSKILNSPVLGDFKYGYKGDKVEGHLLHCFDLHFNTWQANGKMKRICVQAPIPESFQRFSERSGLDLVPVVKRLKADQIDGCK